MKGIKLFDDDWMRDRNYKFATALSEFGQVLDDFVLEIPGQQKRKIDIIVQQGLIGDDGDMAAGRIFIDFES